jgi:signal transduction histidine kinase
VEYAYKLKGWDKNWIAAGNRRFVSYSNIKGGNYIFSVKARLPGGNWVEHDMTIPVIVHTAFYTQVWFYLICFLITVSIVYSLFRVRVQQIKKIEKMRMAISSDLHDEVGTTLSSISIFSEMAKQFVDSSSRAETYLQRIGDRSRDSIEKMSDIIWSINPENDSMHQMLIRMKNFVNEVLEAKDINVYWTECNAVGRLKLDMTKRKNFFLIFKEIVTNAAKHSGSNNIHIDLSATDRIIQLSVKDDGIGFYPEKAGRGNGLKNIQHRVALLNGKVTINSGIGLGTAIVLRFDYIV